MKTFPSLLVSSLIAAASIVSASTVTVYSNNGPPGGRFHERRNGEYHPLDARRGPRLKRLVLQQRPQQRTRRDQHRAAHDGNGSVQFSTTQGPSGNSSKADIEYYNLVGGMPQSLGTLGNLTSFSYSWYRAAGGTAANFDAPTLRLYIASPDLSKQGYIVFEPVYNAKATTRLPRING